MTSEVSGLLLSKSLTVKLFPLEDVFLTGLVATMAGVIVQHIPNFLTDEYERIGPTMSRQWVALHSLNSSTMYKLWSI